MLSPCGENTSSRDGATGTKEQGQEQSKGKTSFQPLGQRPRTNRGKKSAPPQGGNRKRMGGGGRKPFWGGRPPFDLHAPQLAEGCGSGWSRVAGGLPRMGSPGSMAQWPLCFSIALTPVACWVGVASAGEDLDVDIVWKRKGGEEEGRGLLWPWRGAPRPSARVRLHESGLIAYGCRYNVCCLCFQRWSL